MTIEIRPASGFEDLGRWVATRNEVAPDDPDDPTMIALLRASLLEHVNLIALEDGEVVGTGMLAGDPNSLESDHAYVEVMVPERHRGRGIGSALLTELSERVRRLGKQGLHVDAREDDTYSIEFLERRGFVAQEHPADHVVLELDRVEPPDALPPDGVSIHWLADRPDLMALAFEVAAETYPELGGPISKQAGTLHEWQLFELADPQIALELTPIAVAGDKAVGFGALRRIDDRKVGVHRITVVQPAWRRRGVGSAMTRMQITAAKQASFERLEAWPWTDLQKRLYSSLGYERVGAAIDFFGPLQ
jgi:ribosomal protein S18 acetylase RimI-like enzyme